MADGRTHLALADLFLEAYRTGVPVEAPSASHPDLTVEDAYAIQQLQLKAWHAHGDVLRGHKVGLTSRAMQQQLGVDLPDYGALTASMFIAEQTEVPLGRFLQPKIEPEVAFVLGSPLAGPGVTAAQAAVAIEAVLPAIEIIDSRVRDWQIGLVDTIADNASSGAVVLGTKAVGPRDLDLRLMGALVHRNGKIVATGAGGAVLGSPINALVWLANTLGTVGVTLQPGEVVIPGSMTAAVQISPGDSFQVEIAGLGSVSTYFAPDL